MKKARPEIAKRRTGRPSQSQAEKLNDHILDVATELFFSEGYGATSIEAIVRHTRISKQTFYHRFCDKADLFRAVVKRVVGQLRPMNTESLFTGKNLEETLLKLATVILHASLTKQALSLHRLILSESGRFPELALMVNSEGMRQEAIQRLAELLGHDRRSKAHKLEARLFAAEQLMQMIVSVPQRRALGLGNPMSVAELDAWVHDTVQLFLLGFFQI